MYNQDKYLGFMKTVVSISYFKYNKNKKEITTMLTLLADMVNANTANRIEWNLRGKTK